MTFPQIVTSNHQATISSFITACQSDPHILAAVLYGSHAHGAADEWSDLDLAVVVDDPAYDDFVAGREDFIGQLGEPLFMEEFDNPGILFFILSDGTEGELSIERESDFVQPYGHWRPLLDKTGILSNRKPRSIPDPADQTEILRRQIMWFWHDLSHFMTAMARGQLWWASGQLEALRRICLNLARLSHDFADGEVGDDPHFKLEKSLPVGLLARLETTFAPLEREAMLEAVWTTHRFFRELAIPLAEEHGLRYPAELEDMILGRLNRLGELLSS
jgi:predicted nucleotidyltransferase